MWFIDHAQITVIAGDGGRGCSSYAQPPYIRYPYPDGGDGGDGGHVIVQTDPNIATLLDFRFRHEFKAGRGGHGGSNTKTGRRGEDLVIRVPVGTVIHDEETGTVLRDLAHAGEQALLANGGRGGFGNAAAVQALPGEPGRQRRIRFELKLIADAGLVGFPNAGKSSLLSRISTAHPKVAAYPFTTRYPVLGVVNMEGRGTFVLRQARDERPERSRGTFVACDIPGLIEGAHEGKGLGFEFLRHIERTRILLHLVDLAAVDGRDPVAAFEQLNRELAAYSGALAEKPQIIVANKMDLPDARERLAAFTQAVGVTVWPISCATGAGIPALLQAVWKALHDEPA